MWRDVRREETRRFAEILGICGFAVTQPVLASFGDAAEHFAFRGASDAEIIAFPLLVAFVPAAVLTLPGVLARLVGDRFARAVHLATVAVVAFAAVLQGLDAAFAITGEAKALIAVGITAAATWLFARFEGVLLWARLTAAFSLLFVGMFLFVSPVGELAFADPPELAELVVAQPDDAVEPGSSTRSPTFPDIVMIVFDELPTGVLLDLEGDIDALRYPSLAEFADDATWYRTNTTVSAHTVYAVPAILTGQLPADQIAPTWVSHPDTLFRLLGGTYHLTVSEALTRLCPEEWCGTSPVPPPAATQQAEPAETDTATTTTTASVEAAPSTDRGGLRVLLSDAVKIWREQVRVDPSELPLFSGFEEEIDALTTTTTTAAPTSAVAPDIDPLDAVHSEGNDDVRTNLVEEDRAAQIPRVNEFIDTIRPSDDPTLHYLHAVLPHQPFVLTESGARYGAEPIDDVIDGGFEWENAVSAQRMALQMMFTDRLLGDIIDRTKETGIYDEALVIVMADHGANLVSPGFYRYFDGTNAAELMFSPLMVKLPNQTQGIVSDAPSEVVDIVPTIADVLGIDIPWEVDGESLLDRDPAYVDPGCEDRRRLIRFGLEFLGDDVGREELDLCRSELMQDGLRPVLGELHVADEWATAGLARLTPFADLLGTPWDDLDAQPGEGWATLEQAAEVQAGASPPIGAIRGEVNGDLPADWVAVAIDGQIAGISPIHDVKPNPLSGDQEPASNRFTVIVPAPLLTESGYDIRVAALNVVDGELTAAELIVEP